MIYRFVFTAVEYESRCTRINKRVNITKSDRSSRQT